MVKVMLDPGHGGYDPGACANGLQEKVLTLKVVNFMTSLLVYNGIAVGVTRTGDYAPGHYEGNLNQELNERVKLSDAYGADLFVSIHINSGGGTGTEVLISGAGGNAERCAKKVLPYLVQVGGWANRGVKVQNVLVLNKTKAPAILTESGFIDNTSDASKLANLDFLQRLSIAHVRGICEYFNITYQEPNTTPPTPNSVPLRGNVEKATELLDEAIRLLKEDK